jgi:hypothetical protein
VSGEIKFDEECFFVAPIGEEGSDIRKRSDGVLQFIVSRAAEELNLKAVRADKISSPGQINLQVIEHVLSAKVVVADLTGLNPNVFYEVAVRHTAKLPIVLIAEKGTKLPFDISQMRTIFFDHQDLADADSCREGIVEQLSDVLRSGHVDSPISTALDVAHLAGGSAVERTVAELVTTVEEVSRAQRETLRLLHSSGGRSAGFVPSVVLDDLTTNYSRLVHLVSDEPESDVFEAVADLAKPISFLERRLSSDRREDRVARNRSQRLQDERDGVADGLMA